MSAKKLGLAVTCLAGVMSLCFATLQASILQPGDDDGYAPTAYVPIPGYPLKSFDIGYVDVKNHVYLLADRSNQAIDIIDTKTNTFLHQYRATPAFAGAITAPPANASGPNGVIVINGKVNCHNFDPPYNTKNCKPNLERSLIWATDGPTPAVGGCRAFPGPGCSSIKILDLATGATVKVLKTQGILRTDELCYNPDPNNPYVLTANDDPVFDNFIQFWRWDTFELVETISLRGGEPNTGPFPGTANGIEQCQWNPRQNAFYLSIPGTGIGDPAPDPGVVLKIAQPTSTSPGAITDYFLIHPATGCTGPQGLAIGPDIASSPPVASTKNGVQSSSQKNGEIALGCGGTNSLIIDDFGNVVTVVEGVGGTDEAWYDPHSNHFFFADGNNANFATAPGFLGVEDAGGLPAAKQIQEDEFTPGGEPTPDFAPNTQTGSHSVAVYPGTCVGKPRSSQVYVPIRSNLVANTFVPPGGPQTPPWICSTLAAGNNPQADTLGCITIYTAPPACVSTAKSTNPPE
jgi:hypothetical protein